MDMKKHAIIPIFIPHEGCPNDCVFCNQKLITARNADVNQKYITNIIETFLPTLENRNLDVIEVAFFGGSFTGIPIDKQTQYLKVAFEYKKNKRIDKIHLSTRPDYINEEILDNLKAYGVDIIELGVQSFDEEVLIASKRGHTIDSVYKACNLIKVYGFELGIQLMVGLPKDTMDKSIYSAKKTVDIGPSLARIYPTVVLPDTELAKMYLNKTYTPLSEEDALQITKEMYKLLFENHIKILRVGLKSTDLITNLSDLSGGYHPAFRQLVEGEIALEKMLSKISPNITFSSNEKWFNNMIGHKGCNKKYIETHYPSYNISYCKNSNLKDGVIAVTANNMLK